MPRSSSASATVRWPVAMSDTTIRGPVAGSDRGPFGNRKPWPERYRELADQARDPRLQAFYRTGCPAADTPIAEVPLVALDFETTGLDAEWDSIVSIGLVPFTLAAIRPGEGQHWLVKPKKSLSRTSVTIHGITHSDLQQAPDIGERFGELLSALAGRVPVVHYRGIEQPFLNAALQWRLQESIQFPVLDTMEIEAHLHPDRQPALWQRLLGKKPVSIRLADSRRRYNLPHYASHNAMVDALATAELLQAQIQHHFSPQTPIGDLWL